MMKSLILLAIVATVASAEVFDYAGCNDGSKTCFGHMAGADENACIATEDCSLVAGWSSAGGGLTTFEVETVGEGVGAGWVAIGFSADRLMGDDAVVMSGSNMYWNIATEEFKNSLPSPDSDGAIEPLELIASDGSLYASFDLLNEFPVIIPEDGGAVSFVLDGSNYMLIASGPYDENDGETPRKHTNRIISIETAV